MEAELLDAPTAVEEALKEDRAFSLKDRELTFRLLADFDALVVEIRSAFELTAVFVESFRTGALGLPPTSSKKEQYERVVDALSLNGSPHDWIEEIKRLRNTFLHEAPAWPAVRVESLNPLSFGIGFSKVDTGGVAADDFTGLREFDRICSGFRQSHECLSNWLEAEIERAEKAG